MDLGRWAARGLLWAGLLVPLRGQGPVPSVQEPVFTLVFEVKGNSSGGLSASSQVEVQFAPGPVWHGRFGTNFGGKDMRSPQQLFKLRGGLYGLLPGESMCFGILSHRGTASAGGRTLSGPGAIQQDASGVAWSLKEDAARFTRTEDGGELQVGPVVYLDDEPPEFGLLTPGGYDGGPAGSTAYGRLCTFRFTHEELRNLDRVRKSNQASINDATAGVRQFFKSSLSGGGPEDVTEVTVEPDGYDDWIPEGNLDQPGKVGNRLKVKITAHKKGEPSVARKVHLDLLLQDVSMEKGVCLNWPTVGAKPDYGLRLLPEENPELEVIGPDQARTREAVESLTLLVTAHDFGAWGTLHLEAKDEAKREAKVKVRGEEKPDLRMPKDENRNRIADAWELAWAGGLQGVAAEDEDAMPEGDGHTGDVLSRYEEYRGFRISGGAEQTADGGRPRERMTGRHVRTDPRVKDVFICDTVGLGIGAFRASGLQVHLVSAQECGRSQGGAYNPYAINPNRGSFTKGEQHVLRLESGNPGTGYAGEAIMKGGNPSVPRDCQRIVVGAPPAAGTPWLRPDQETLVTLTHELAHACNVKHHGSKAAVDVVRSESLSDHSTQVGDGLLVSEGGNSTASGDVHCYMAYTPNFVQELAHPKFWVWDRAGNRYTATQWNPNSPRFAKYRFCDARGPIELGPAGPAAPGLGDCARQFCVNHLRH